MSSTGITSTNYTSISYIEETTPGTTPASPAFQLLPTTGGAPAGNVTTTVSEVIRRDRQTDDLIVTDAEVGGEINYELSYGPYKPLITALLQGTTVAVAETGLTDIAAVNATSEYTSTSTDFVDADIVAGMNVRFSGFTNAANNGIKQVVSVTTNSLVVDDAALVDEAAGATVEFDSTMIRNGAEDATSFTFLKMIEGLTNTAYFYYPGCQISMMNFNFETGSILNGSFEVVGTTEEPTETAKASQSIVDVPSYALMNSVSSVTSIDVQGLPAGTEFSTLNLSVDNSINRAKAIGTLGAIDLASFTLNVTADITLYFRDLVTYGNYVNANSFFLSFTLTDGDGNILVLTLPKCKFEELDVPIDGKDSFLMLSGSLKALRDPGTNSTIQIEFFDAP